MEFIGEAFLSFTLRLVIDELRSSDVLKFARREKVSNELKKWEKNLLKIQAVLQDADENQITSRVLKLWLEDLRDLAFDLDDLLDEFATQQKLMNKSKFTVSHCPKLMSPICLSSLLELNIPECNEVMLSGLSSLTTLKIRKCFPIDEGCSQLMSLAIPDLVSLKYLQIESCPNLVSFRETGFGSMLRHLILKDCPALKALPKDIMIDCESNSCLLEELEIEGCCSLEFFPKGKLSTTLKRLTIQYCENLRSLPEGVMQDDNNSCLLEKLEIEGCRSLEFFPKGKLSTTLKRLTIQSCENLRSLPEGVMRDDNNNYKSQLEILKIVGCPSLQCSTSGKLPYGLKILKISGCLSLEPLIGTMIEDGELLEYIEFSHCETLEILPEFRNSLSHLTEITIIGCPFLNNLPKTGLPTSLQVLMICDCPRLLSLGCLPPNLTSLEIWNCMNLNPMSEWKLHGLTSLIDFSISGECFRDIITFPGDEYLLPGNLISLCISKLENLETLTRGLNNLTLLQELEIIRCHKLRSLPSEGLPSSLGRLRISDFSLENTISSWGGASIEANPSLVSIRMRMNNNRAIPRTSQPLLQNTNARGRSEEREEMVVANSVFNILS
ncbi:hypothetical protein Q3G72_021124 [Acer saccharum]|nr:hypothetical protein Q3G72_021124 [Acer saccharum]